MLFRSEVIGSGVFAGSSAKLTTTSMAPSEITRSRFLEDICTSSTPPLEVSSGCKEMVSRCGQQWIDMKRKPRRVWEAITFEGSWFDEEACGSFRALLVFTPCSVWIETRGATGSGTGLFLEADGGTSGWLCVVFFSGLSAQIGRASCRERV